MFWYNYIFLINSKIKLLRNTDSICLGVEYKKLVKFLYSGESVLHIAIVNEDPAMVKFLLDSGADYHERCTGNFMCPEDQKATRQDTVEHEWVNLSPLTNYEGWVKTN